MNIHEKELCVQLLIYKDQTRIQGQQNIKFKIKYYENPSRGGPVVPCGGKDGRWRDIGEGGLKKQRAVFRHSNRTEFQVTCQLQTRRIYSYILLVTQGAATSTRIFLGFLVYKQMLRRFPTFQVATTCFSCSPPDLNLLVTNFIFCLHVK